jgi:CRISP-associated protein Cas1
MASMIVGTLPVSNFEAMTSASVNQSGLSLVRWFNPMVCTSARHPIPDEWRTVGPRFTRVYATGSRNASHPVNAILNYVYAVLQSQVQIGLVAEGYDPMLGIMHSDRGDAAAFVFDMMEPDRPKVDRAVLGFLKSETLHPADFMMREDGVVRLHPELARHVAKLQCPQ